MIYRLATKSKHGKAHPTHTLDAAEASDGSESEEEFDAKYNHVHHAAKT